MECLEASESCVGPWELDVYQGEGLQQYNILTLVPEVIVKKIYLL